MPPVTRAAAKAAQEFKSFHEADYVNPRDRTSMWNPREITIWQDKMHYTLQVECSYRGLNLQGTPEELTARTVENPVKNYHFPRDAEASIDDMLAFDAQGGITIVPELGRSVKIHVVSEPEFHVARDEDKPEAYWERLPTEQLREQALIHGFENQLLPFADGPIKYTVHDAPREMLVDALVEWYEWTRRDGYVALHPNNNGLISLRRSRPASLYRRAQLLILDLFVYKPRLFREFVAWVTVLGYEGLDLNEDELRIRLARAQLERDEERACDVVDDWEGPSDGCDDKGSSDASG